MPPGPPAPRLATGLTYHLINAMNEQHVSSSRLASEFDEKCAVKADKKMKYDLFAVVKPIKLQRLLHKSRFVDMYHIQVNLGL